MTVAYDVVTSPYVNVRFAVPVIALINLQGAYELAAYLLIVEIIGGYICMRIPCILTIGLDHSCVGTELKRSVV